MQGYASRSFQAVKVISLIRHVIISAALFVLETVVGLGVLGMGVGLVMMIVATASAMGTSGQRRHHLGVAVIYAALCASTMGVILSNWRVAQGRAIPVIAAIEHFHSDRGRYPNALTELCPSY